MHQIISPPWSLDDGLHEHELLIKRLADLHQSAKPVEGPEHLVFKLHRFRELVTFHFRHEEAGGYLKDTCADSSQFQSRAEDLLQQHGALMSELNDLIATAESFFQKLGRYAEVFQKHERDEHRILQDAVNTTIEAAD